MHAERYFDPDPTPRRSPRLYADVGGLACEATADRRPKRLTLEQRARLARDIAIYQAIEAGMSYRVASKAFGLTPPGILKAYRRMVCRKTRV